MASSYSNNLRIELIANGEQSGTWGSTTNNNLGNLIESAISGWVAVNVTSGAQALSALNGTVDQSRNMSINLFGGTGNFTIYIPPAEKFYVFHNSTAYTATISAATAVNGTTPTGGTTVAIPAGKIVSVFCDASNVRMALTHIAGNFSVDGTLSSTAATFTTPLAATSGGTGFNSYTVGSMLFAGTTSELYALSPGTAGYVLTTQGAGNPPAWGLVNLATSITGNLPVANLNSGTNADATRFWRGDGVWAVPAGAGDVVGPSSSTANAIPLYADTTGKTLINSGMTYNNGTSTLTVQNFLGNGASLTNLNPANLSSAVPTSKGGTGLTTVGSNGQVLTVVSGVPAWQTPSSGGGGVTSFQTTLSGLTPSIATTGVVTLGGTLGVGGGGTGLSSVTAGALLYASNTNVIGQLTIGGTGTTLRVSGGIPSWQASVQTIDGVSTTSSTAGAVRLNELTAFNRVLGTSDSSNGYQNLPGGMKMVWGYQAVSAASTVITFPYPFSFNCFMVSATPYVASDTGGIADAVAVAVQPTATGVTFSTNAAWDGIYWFAIGR